MSKENIGGVPKYRFPEFSGASYWQEKLLDSIVEFYKGRGISKADIDIHGVTKCIRYGELYTKYGEVINIVHSATNLSTSSLFLSKYNDVILPSSGETKLDIATASCMLLDNIALGGDLIVIRTQLNGIFLSYYFNGVKKREIASIAQGDTVVHLYANKLKAINIFIPTRDEQQKIADCLTSLDELIDAENKKLEALKAHKKGLMQKLFPAEGKVNPQVRLGVCTDDWAIRKLDDLGIATGGTAIESEFVADGKYRVISIGSYSENSIYTDQNIRANLSSKTQNRILNKGDLAMILNDKTSKGNIIGRVLLIDEDDAYVYNQRTQRIQPHHAEYDSDFLYHLFNAPEVRAKIVKQAQGNTQIYVNWSAIRELAYRVPSRPEQTLIGVFFRNLDDKITAQSEKIQALKLHKKGLMQGLFPSTQEVTK